MDKNTLLPNLTQYIITSGKSVFTSAEISGIYVEFKANKLLPSKTSLAVFGEFLLENSIFQLTTLHFPSRVEKRFCLKNYSKYELAMSLRRGGYLSHRTAAYLHGFLDESMEIYLNYEQTPKPPPKGTLTQEGIDLAFKNNSRVTKNKALVDKNIYFILSGKNTSQLGVIDHQTSQNETLRITDIERTLIDIAVRPVYAGGVSSVLDAYKKASEFLSIKKIVTVHDFN